MIGEHPPAIVSSAAGTNAGGSRSSETAAIELFGVTKTFGDGGSATPALGPLDLAIETGSFVSIVGPSGCGKSTLLRLVAGLEKPTSGQLWVGNEAIEGPHAQRGLVFQDPNLFPWLTVRRNIQSGLVARHLLREKRHEVDEYLRLVGLEKFAEVFPHHLSGGMA